MKKKLLIFDLDGTLFDTLGDLTEAVNVGLTSCHKETVTIEHVRKAIGNGVETLIARCLENGRDNPDYQEVLTNFRKYYRANYMVYTKPYENMEKTLQNLIKNGYILACVTNKIDEVAKDIINHFFPHLFAYIQGDCKEFKKKPSPDMVNHVLEQLHINKEDAIYIGDTNVDYETAVNSGLDVLLVTYGYRIKEEMEQYHYNCPKVDTSEQIEHYFLKE